jgi:alpha-tubulin suppressor-like RCC1 family protein
MLVNHRQVTFLQRVKNIVIKLLQRTHIEMKNSPLIFINKRTIDKALSECSDSLLLLPVTNDGRFYMIFSDSFVNQNEQVVKVAAGTYHLIILTNVGNVYCIGSNKQHACGFPEPLLFSKVTHMDTFYSYDAHTLVHDVVITDVECCNHFTTMIDNQGRVFFAGTNDLNRMGSLPSNLTVTQYPTMMNPNYINNEKITIIAPGIYHTLMHSDKGTLYIAGYVYMELIPLVSDYVLDIIILV